MKRKYSRTSDTKLLEQEILDKLKAAIFLSIPVTLIALALDLQVLVLAGFLQNSFLLKFFSIITLFGEIEIFFILLILLSILFLLLRLRFLVLWVATFLSFLFGTSLKLITMRPRPFEYLGVSSLVPVQLSSFPSGHTLAFFTLLPILNASFPRWKILFWSLAVLVGFSRIVLGVHYLSDVVAGAFLGYIIGNLALWMEEKYGWRR
jgi:undecaprenyl-diphosphatase